MQYCPARDIHSRNTCYSHLTTGRVVEHSIDDGIMRLACLRVVLFGMVGIGKMLTTSSKVDTLSKITLVMYYRSNTHRLAFMPKPCM